MTRVAELIVAFMLSFFSFLLFFLVGGGGVGLDNGAVGEELLHQCHCWRN
jgi:hypothetical protein